MTATKDFYSAANQHFTELNDSEKRIFDYILKNFDQIKFYSIRELALRCYVSSTTIFRFAKKLGFNGYSDFIESLTVVPEAPQTIPHSIKQKDFKDEYLKNIVESVRVTDQTKIEQFNQLLDLNPVLYLMGEDLDLQALHYVHWLFTAQGFRAVLLQDQAAVQNALRHITDQDIFFAFAYTGDNSSIVEAIERVRQNSRATIVSFTRAVTNVIQNLCDIDFYVFSDEIGLDHLDLTSRISMLAIVELIFYHRFNRTLDE
ncbi:MurR/RpiR family transcriptional regulator [Candidatus Enterococcus ferrettii]|uniref:RpiR family transcriptional regulator, glv operon transcriptional regulator n=1 Tax=Candidatus Enterococcus ferrettii TaxID=2815324 RepID=A0ABV0EY03_9ENTE|nr:MurR/RpiR family transcriptional regulator [Enterococcus sp. 665A]MBO1339555.1 MurR/RpiR family transcriptional regulator [Enterococcus sp. 665A]